MAYGKHAVNGIFRVLWPLTRSYGLFHMAWSIYAQWVATNPRTVGPFTLRVAAEVRRQRLRRRWQQDELARYSGVPQGTLSRLERGLTAIDVEQIEQLATTFGMLAEEFLSSARANEGKPIEPDEETYLPNGQLNPANTKGAKPSKERLNELSARKRQGSGG